jgi:hypothetical protein
MIAPDKPDWRWHVVTPLLDYTSAQAAPHVQRFDADTQRVYRFRRQFRNRLVATLPAYVNAHEIWINRAYQRSVLEGLLLGGAEDAHIQEEMEIGKDDIAAYTAMCFDVRGRRKADISNMVFQGMPHRGFSAHDQRGSMHRLGWFGGYKLIQAILARGLNPMEAQQLCTEVCRDIMRRQMPEMGMGMGVQSQFAPEYFKITNEWDANKPPPASELESDLLKSLGDAVGPEGVSVADPTVEANLRLPAAEPCYVETYEVRK